MLIGIDGGGTKTALVLAEENGRLLNTVKGLGSNPADIGLEECENRLRSELDELLRGFGGREAAVDSVYAGIAGSANERTKAAVGEILRRLLPNARRVDNGSDAFNALYGEAEEGIALIAGTGSSAFMLTKDGSHQVGGWGYLVDDAGSGFRVGADALKAAYRSYDGRGEKTKLEELCARRLELPLGEAIPRIYEGGKRYIATFSFAVLEAAHAGDAIAEGILSDAANALADHLRACLRFVSARPAVAVVSGGLIENDEIFERVRAALGAQKNDVQLVRPDVAPVYGALVKAARNAGVPIAETFRESFKRDYHL